MLRLGLANPNPNPNPSPNPNQEKRATYASGGWSRMLRGRLEGPFPYAFGTFYAVSQPLARWLAASPFVARAVAQLEADRWSRQMAYTEDLVFGWAVSRAANTSAVSFPKGNFDNFDAARGMQVHYRLAADCFRRHALGPDNFTTGSYSKWGQCCAEFLTPRQIVAHHVETAAQWRRARLMAERWSAEQSEPCFYPPSELIYRTSAPDQWESQALRTL